MLGFDIPKTVLSVGKDVIIRCVYMMLRQQEDDALTQTKKSYVLVRPELPYDVFEFDKSEEIIEK